MKIIDAINASDEVQTNVPTPAMIIDAEKIQVNDLSLMYSFEFAGFVNKIEKQIGVATKVLSKKNEDGDSIVIVVWSSDDDAFTEWSVTIEYAADEKVNVIRIRDENDDE